MKKKNIYFLILSFLFLLSSCSFNKLFLVPDKLSSDKDNKIIDRDKKDTVTISFSPKNFQPCFVNQHNDTLNADYTIESVLFKSKSGNTLNGWWLKPKGEDNGITLLHFHGNAGNLLWQFRAISPLVKKGFSVFMFDYSGFGFSEGKASRKNVLLDGISALEYVKSNEAAKKNKLIIYGQSLGGNLAAVVASRRESDIDAVVIEGAFSSHKDIAADLVRKVALVGFAGRVFTKEGYSAKRNITKFHKPVLVIHSTEDKTIPFKMGKKIFKNANDPKEFYEIKHCHICGPSNYPGEITEKILKMVGK